MKRFLNIIAFSFIAINSFAADSALTNDSPTAQKERLYQRFVKEMQRRMQEMQKLDPSNLDLSIFPIIAGDIISARPPHDRNVKLLDQLNKIFSESVLVREGRFRIINAALNHRAYRFNKGAVDIGVHFSDFSVQINFNNCRLPCGDFPGDQVGENGASK